jgi:hypothetical protein
MYVYSVSIYRQTQLVQYSGVLVLYFERHFARNTKKERQNIVLVVFDGKY